MQMVLWILGAIISAALSLFLTGKVFRLLRLRRELRELGHETTPQIDKPATALSVASILVSVFCGIVCFVSIHWHFHLPKTALLIGVFFATARWIDLVSRWDKTEKPVLLHTMSDSAAQLTTVAVLAVLWSALAIPVSAVPFAARLLIAGLCSGTGVHAMWQWREQTVHTGAFSKTDALARDAGIRRAAKRYALGYAAVFSLCGVMDWAVTAGIVKNASTIWESILLFSFFFVDIFVAHFAFFGFAEPPKAEAKERVVAPNG